MLSINGPLYFLETTPGSTRDEIYPNTACLSGTAKLGDSAVKNAIRVSVVENWSTALRGPSAVVVFTYFFFFFFLYNTYLLSAGPARWTF